MEFTTFQGEVRSTCGKYKKLYQEGNWLIVEDVYSFNPFKLDVFNKDKFVTYICPYFDSEEEQLRAGSLPSYDRLPKKIKRELRNITMNHFTNDFLESDLKAV